MSEASDTILLLTPGKVGTKSVERMLNQTGLKILASHAFTPAAIARRQDLLERLGWPPDAVASKIEANKIMLDTISVGHERARTGRGGKIRIATVVRDPIARMLSEQLHSMPDDAIQELVSLLGIGGLAEHFTGKIENGLDRMLQRSNEWYDDLQWASGISLASQANAHDHPYVIVESEAARLLVLKLERTDAFATAIKAFCGSGISDVVHTNSAAERGSSSLLKDVRAAISVPMKVIEEFYKMRWVRACYSEREISGFRVLWSNDEPSTGAPARQNYDVIVSALITRCLAVQNFKDILSGKESAMAELHNTIKAKEAVISAQAESMRGQLQAFKALEEALSRKQQVVETLRANIAHLRAERT